MTDQWHIKRVNKVHGPISLEQLRNLASTGKLRPTDLIRNDKSDWRQADSISGLFPQAGHRKTPPKLPSAQLTIVRKPKLTGFLSSVSVKIDGEERGSLGGGIPSGIIDLLTSSKNEMSFEVAPGTHSIQVSGGGLKTEKSFNLKPGQNLTLCTLFSNMGAMGGGLRLDEDQTGSPVSSQTKPDLNAERKSWSLKGIVGLGIVCFGFFILCAGIFGGISGSSRGTSTTESQTGITENLTNNTEKKESEGSAPAYARLAGRWHGNGGKLHDLIVQEQKENSCWYSDLGTPPSNGQPATVVFNGGGGFVYIGGGHITGTYRLNGDDRIEITGQGTITRLNKPDVKSVITDVWVRVKDNADHTDASTTNDEPSSADKWESQHIVGDELTGDWIDQNGKIYHFVRDIRDSKMQQILDRSGDNLEAPSIAYRVTDESDLNIKGLSPPFTYFFSKSDDFMVSIHHEHLPGFQYGKFIWDGRSLILKFGKGGNSFEKTQKNFEFNSERKLIRVGD